VYHVWNRAAGRLRLFKKAQDYLAFERILVEAHQRHPIPLLDWCLMPNHWHFVVYPREDGQVSDFFRWLTHTHAMRAIAHRRVMGMGPLYQGRFKSLPVQQDEHLLTLLAYVQRNPVRAKLVKTAADWRWSAEAVRRGAHGVGRSSAQELQSLLTDWPVDRPRNWPAWVDRQPNVQQTDAIQECIARSRPFGEEKWTKKTAQRLDMMWTLHSRGRPRGTEKELRPL
jgi:putative transposase